MIDLNKFTEEEIKLIEDMIDSKIKFEYEFQSKHSKLYDKFAKEREKEIEALTILKTKIINLKSIDKNKL
jgi:hypothetical protein